MSDDKNKSIGSKTIIAGAAIGSAAIAAGLLYASKRKKKSDTEAAPIIPSGENPETD